LPIFVKSPCALPLQDLHQTSQRFLKRLSEFWRGASFFLARDAGSG
jgi:hypothetical protein